MDDQLELFIRERKERVAQDRAWLEQDPSYMEVTVCVKPRGTLLSITETGVRSKCVLFPWTNRLDQRKASVPQ